MHASAARALPSFILTSTSGEVLFIIWKTYCNGSHVMYNSKGKALIIDLQDFSLLKITLSISGATLVSTRQILRELAEAPQYGE